MNNYSYWCEGCNKFLPTRKTEFKVRSDGTKGCPNCGTKVNLNCYWVLVVERVCGKEFVKARVAGLDVLEKLCYNCDSRFMCWTESL